MTKQKIKQWCISEAINRCFMPSYKITYKCKSRTLKSIRREIIKDCLRQANVNKIKFIVDDYTYWIARNTHKLLHPDTKNTFYVI
jgi:hypothetical protein